MANEQLRSMIRDGARQAFSTIQNSNPGEAFYTFSLQSMSDVSGVYAHANTEAGYLAAVERYRNWKEKVDERYCRWYWAEWKYRSLGPMGHDGDPVYDLLNSDDFHNSESSKLSSSVCLSPSDLEVVSGRAYVQASMIAALGDLDREGVFGRDSDRERVTLFCSVEDASDDAMVTDESACRLNPPDAYLRCTVDGPVFLTRRHWHDIDLVQMARILDEWGFPRQSKLRSVPER